MKAILALEYGPPDRLRFEDADKPVPSDDEVLIRLRGRTECAQLLHDPWHLRDATVLWNEEAERSASWR